MSQSWEPILSGSDRDLALDIVSSIASMMRNVACPNRSGLMGVTGISIFLVQAHEAGLDSEFGAVELLENGLSALSSGRIDLGLWTGAAGLRWVVSKLTVGGTPTAGTNGNLAEVTEPSGCRTTFSGLRVTKHDGSRLHLIGIQPTIRASRTIAGVVAGRDEVLDKALAYVRDSSK